MAVQNTGKRVVLQVDGSVEVCRVTISRYLNAPVRVGSSYRVGYYFIYFLVALQNTGKRVVLQVHGSSVQNTVWSSKWTVEWKSAGSPFPGTYKQCAKCASKSRLWL